MNSDSGPRWLGFKPSPATDTLLILFCASVCFFFHQWDEGENMIFIIKSLTGLMDSKQESIHLKCRKSRFIAGWGRSWSRKWQPTPADLPGESHGQRSLEGYSPWGHKSWTQLSDSLSLSHSLSHTHTHTHTRAWNMVNSHCTSS